MRSSPALHSVPISIHALREEGDDIDEQLVRDIGKFLSTPSARRATTQKELKQSI